MKTFYLIFLGISILCLNSTGCNKPEDEEVDVEIITGVDDDDNDDDNDDNDDDDDDDNDNDNDDDNDVVDINASFATNKSVATIGESIIFTNESENYEVLMWDFGDGNSSTKLQPSHAYTTEGDFTVILTVEYQGMSDTYEKLITVLSPNNRWAYFVNNNIGSIDSAYMGNAFILTPGGGVYRNREGIADYYQETGNVFGQVHLVLTLGEKAVNRNSAVIYEIGTFTGDNDHSYKHLLIWQKVSGVFLRKFEIIALVDGSVTDTGFLEQRRVDWVDGSNSHNAAAFVADIYTEDAVYYWHSANQLSIGNSAVANAYQYMNSPTWSINTLTPYHCEPVNSEIIYEIGIYSGPAGTGEYVIIWRKDTDDIWRVLFDSNY